MPIKFSTHDMERVTVTFDTPDEAKIFHKQMRLQINSRYGKFGMPPSHDAAAEFHRQRGCCNGTDLVKCWNDRNAEQDRLVAERKAEREAAKKRDRNPRSEYEGCE